MQKEGVKQVIGRKSRVEDHVMKQHLSLDEVPYYCRLCRFVTDSWTSLQGHVKGYKTHARIRDGKGMKDSDLFLVKNPSPYKIGPQDWIMYSQEDSARIYASRAKPQKDPLNQLVDAVVQSDDMPDVDLLLSYDEISQGSSDQGASAPLETAQTAPSNMTDVSSWVNATLSMPTLDNLGVATATPTQRTPGMTPTLSLLQYDERSTSHMVSGSAGALAATINGTGQAITIGQRSGCQRDQKSLRAATATLTHAGQGQTEGRHVAEVGEALGAVTATPTHSDQMAMDQGAPLNLSRKSTTNTASTSPPLAHSTPVTRTVRLTPVLNVTNQGLPVVSHNSASQSLPVVRRNSQSATPTLDELPLAPTPVPDASETENILPQLLDHGQGDGLRLSPLAEPKEDSVKVYLEGLGERMTKAIDSNSRAIRCMEKSLKALQDTVKQLCKEGKERTQDRDQPAHNRHRASPYARDQSQPGWGGQGFETRRHRFPSQETELNLPMRSAVSRVPRGGHKNRR